MTKEKIRADESLWRLYDKYLARGHYSAAQVAGVLVELGLASSAEEWPIHGEMSGDEGVSSTLWVLSPRVCVQDFAPRLILDLDGGHGGSRIYQPLRRRQLDATRDWQGLS